MQDNGAIRASNGTNQVDGGQAGLAVPKPNRMVSDFEWAILAAMEIYFPSREARGCFCHFGQVHKF